YAKSSCVISRAFGEGEARTLFGLKPAPNSESVRLLIIRPSPRGRGSTGDAKVALSGGMIPEWAYYTTVTSNGVRVTSVDLPRSTLDPLAKGESITVKVDKYVNTRIRPTAFDKALAAL